MTRLTLRQIAQASGRAFDVPGVVDGCSKVRFCDVYPSGNVGLKRASDPESFGAFSVSPTRAEPLIALIDKTFRSKA